MFVAHLKNKKLKICNMLQQVFNQARLLLKHSNALNIPAADINTLKSHLHKLRTTDLDLDRHKPKLFVKDSPSVKAANIYKGKEFDIDVFAMPKGSVMPIHDHPSMMVFTKVLFGSIRITAYDWKDQNDAYLREADLSLEKTIEFGAEPFVLFPNKYNLHTITALSDAIFFDILTPPYDFVERNCNYYKIQTRISKEKVVLAPSSANFGMEEFVYAGPKIKYSVLLTTRTLNLEKKKFLVACGTMDGLRGILPREIIDLAISYMDNNTKRMFRATNKYWLQAVKLDDFCLYFATPKTIPDMVQHFSKHYQNRSIGISLRKIILRENEDIPLEHFAILTNLTSFQLDQYSSSKINTATILYALTNLQYLQPMFSSSSTLTNLTTLEVENLSCLQFLPLYTKLRYLSLRVPTDNPFTLVPNPSQLTEFRYQWSANTEDPNILAKFSNLKALDISTQSRDFAPPCLEYLTSLEKLRLYRLVVPKNYDLSPLSRLTYLHLDSVEIPNLAVLPNLKILALYAASTRVHDGLFLSALTNLEHYANYHFAESLVHLNSWKLTELRFYDVAENFDIEQLLKLTNLLCLRTSEETILHSATTLNGLRSISNLTALSVRRMTTNKEQFTVLNCLENLKSLYLGTVDPMLTNNYISLKHLSNLEDVDFGSPPSQTLYNDMCYLTRLTELTFTVTKNVLENNPTALERLPLKCLTFQKQVISYQLWNLLSRLQDLESLYVWRVNSERIIESFSVLTNLTGLTMKRTRKTKRILLSKLTNLQVLQFASQPARKYYKKGRHDLREKIPRLVVKDFMS